MIQTDRENIVMGYAANEVAAFAVLCNEAETGVLDAKIDAVDDKVDALTFFKTIGNAIATGNNDTLTLAVSGNGLSITTAGKTITFDVSGLNSIISALKFFKSIGGVQAGANDDTLAVTGSGGITITSSQANKKIDIDGSWLKTKILALEAWNNSSANAARVASWMEQLPAGSYLKNKYLITELAKPLSSDRAAYWNAILASIPSRTYFAWVAFNSEHMCMVRPGNTVTISGQTYTLATVYLPHKESCLVMMEVYASETTVSDVVEMDWDVNWSVVMRMFYDLQTEVSARAAAVTAEATARANAVSAEAETRAAADTALGGRCSGVEGRCTQLEYELTDADMVEIMG